MKGEEKSRGNVEVLYTRRYGEFQNLGETSYIRPTLVIYYNVFLSQFYTYRTLQENR